MADDDRARWSGVCPAGLRSSQPDPPHLEHMRIPVCLLRVFNEPLLFWTEPDFGHGRPQWPRRLFLTKILKAFVEEEQHDGRRQAVQKGARELVRFLRLVRKVLGKRHDACEGGRGCRKNKRDGDQIS
jgi:hypothetical protein